MTFLIRLLTAILKDNKHKKQWRVFSTIMAGVVVFVTTYSLILPAITLEDSAARKMEGLHLESAETTGALGTDDGWEDFQVVPDEENPGHTSVGQDGASDQAPMIEAVLDDAMKPADSGDGILIEEYADAEEGGNGADDQTEEENASGQMGSAGELTTALTFADEEKTQASLRLQYGADAMIPEGTAGSARAFDARQAESDDAQQALRGKLAQRYEQSVLETVAAEHPDWTDVSVRMFDLKLSLDGETVQPQKKIAAELTFAQPCDCAQMAFVHFRENDPEKELAAISAGELAGTDAVGITAPVIMNKAQITRNEAGAVTQIGFSAKRLNVFAVVTAGGQPEAEVGEATETEVAEQPEAQTGEETESETAETEANTESVDAAETETDSETEPSSSHPEQNFTQKTEHVHVQVYAPEGAFPAGTTMTVTDIDDDETIAAISDAAATEQSAVRKVRAVDITFRNAQGEEIEPLQPIRVEITAEEKREDENAVVVHVDSEGNAQTVDDAVPLAQMPADTELLTAAADMNEAAAPHADAGTMVFEADQFSVYAIVYTVDFHWSVNGKTYELSIPGGGYVSLEALLEVLGITEKDGGASTLAEESREAAEAKTAAGLSDSALSQDDVQVSERTKQFVTDVERVEFSSPDLLFVSRVEKDTTIGAIRDSLDLSCDYSADLTPAQIEQINASAVSAGDWALISLKPFNTEETLTITMKTGEVFTIRVTDANVAKENVQDGVGYIIFTKGSDNNYYVLKGDGTTERFDNADGFDELTNDYKWTVTHVYTEDEAERFNIHSYTNPAYSLALNFPDRALLASGANNIIVQASGDGYTFTGFNSTMLNLVQDSSGKKFVGSADGAAVMYFYEQADLNSFKFTVSSSDIKKGTVTGRDNVGVMQNSAQYTAGTTSDKKNQYTIRAVPQSEKYIFDHWELNGTAISAGSTINPEELNIPFNGSSLEAVFKVNPNYNASDDEKEGKGFDDASKAALQAWLNELKGRQVPLNPKGCKKTAEVYDYDNRVYRVDLTAQSSLTTFDGVIDLGFIMDVSGSMQFPSKLSPLSGYESYNINQINNGHQNDLNPGQSYYLIADRAGTATVYRLFYGSQQEQTWYGTTTRTGWWAVDASYQNNDSRHFYIDNNTRFASDTAGMSYQIYTDGDNGKKRLEYLISSVNGTVADLREILGILALAGSATQNPDVKIAYNTFFSQVNTQQHAFISAKDFNEEGINWATNGGTATDAALADARDFEWGTVNAGTRNYAILITDGAPQAGGRAIDNQTVINQANELKKGPDGVLGTADDVKLITVGLSMGDVKRGSVLLYDLADRDSDNEKLFFKAESGDELEYALYEILQKIMVDASVQGNVTDTVGEAFYPVDLTTGVQLTAGNVINLKGELISQTEAGLTQEQKAEGYGVIQQDGKTIVWTNQEFTHEGWHGTVYVKAKEDLLGGNAMRTNSGDASIQAVSYKTPSMTQPVALREKAATDKNYILEVNDLASPLVNVNELSFDMNETDWTVYLGTDVDPGKQLEALWKKILVEEKVTAGQDLEPEENGDNLQDHVTGGKEHYLYPLKQSISDKRESEIESGKTPVTFTMNDLIKKLVEGKDYSWWDYAKGEPKYKEFFEAASTGNGITLDYDVYGLNDMEHHLDNETTKRDGSTINIKLTKEITDGEIAAGVDPLDGQHATKITGDAVEKYTLTVLYSPDYEILPEGQGGKSIEDFHVGSWGTMYHGHAAGTETSTNVHTINVYTKPLEVKKIDPDGATLPGAVFGIYRPADAENGESGISLSQYNSSLTGSYILVSEGTSGADGLIRLADTGNTEATLLVPGKDYILIETEAPENYERDDSVRHVQVTVEDGSYTDLKHQTIMEEVAGEGGGTVAQARTDMAGYEDPYNWSQGVRIAVDGKVIVAADPQAGNGTGTSGGAQSAGNPEAAGETQPAGSSEQGGEETAASGSAGQDPVSAEGTDQGIPTRAASDERNPGANEYIRSAEPVLFRTTIINKLNTTTIDVTKRWTDDKGEDKSKDGCSITFKVTRKAGESGTAEDVSLTGHITAGEGISVNNDGSSVTLSWQAGSGWPVARITGLEKYADSSAQTLWVYEAVETICNPEGSADPAKAKYEVTEVNGIRTITIVNIEKIKTRIEVEKKWFAPDGTTELTQAPEESITFEVYRKAHIPCIHDYTNQDWVTETEPTCTADGRKYRACSKCHEKEYAAIPATGHSWGEWTVRTPATYTADGVEARTCSVCGQEETRTITKLPHDHVYDRQVTVKEPGCTTPGTAKLVCSLCGEESGTTVQIPALGHSWDDGTVTKPATCEATGVRTCTCTRCGEKQTREIAALGHDWQTTDDPAATCTTAGTRHWVCRNDASHNYDETIAALGHKWGEWETYIEATQTTPGENRRYCLNDPSHYESVVVPKLGETFGETGLPVNKYEWPDTSSWTQDERNKQTTIDPTGIIKYTDKNGNVSYAIIYQRWTGSYEQMKDGPGSSALQNNAVVLTGTIKTKADIVNNSIQPISKGDLFKTDDGEYYVFLKNDGRANNLNNGFSTGDWYHIPKTSGDEGTNSTNSVNTNSVNSTASTASLNSAGTRTIRSTPKAAKMSVALAGLNSLSAAEADSSAAGEAADSAAAGGDLLLGAAGDGESGNGASDETAARKARIAALTNTTPDQITFRSELNDQSNLDVWEYVTSCTGSGTDWSWLLKNLDAYDDDGNEYTYYVVETAPDESLYEISYVDNGLKDSDEKDTITIRNTQKTGSVEVTKTFAGLAPEQLPSRFKITATYTENGVQKTVELTAATEGVSGNGTTEPYRWTIDNLVIGTVVTFTESGYDVPGYNVVTTPAADESGTVSASATAAQTSGTARTASFINTYTQVAKVTLDILKIEKDNPGRKLPGAIFTLREINSEITRHEPTYKTENDPGISRTTGDQASGHEGETAFEDLETGYYEIRETGIPDGYVITGDAAFYIRVYDGKAELIKVNDTGDGWDVISSIGNFEFGAAETDGRENALVTVSNEPGAALPSTGGPGTNLLYLLGIMLTAFAGGGLMLKRRRS